MTEVCGKCAHAFDHNGKQCQHNMPDGTQCPCSNGIRSDVLACRQNAEIIKRIGEVQATLVYMTRLTAFIHNIDVGGDGEFIRRRPAIQLFDN